MIASVISVHTGRIAPLGAEGVPSGFVKHRRDGAVTVGETGLDGDEIADLTVHGGPDKAVYGYGVDHYPRWAAEQPGHAGLFGPGVMGENLAIAGLTEADLCVGDVHRIGDALLQACQPRQPCFKLALRFDDPMMVKAMVKSRRSGWYYRVLKAGRVAAGDAVALHARPNPDFPFSRLVEIVYARDPSREELTRMAAMDGLARQWVAQAKMALRADKSS
jgi:MOSC domain-containing protein YiiM